MNWSPQQDAARRTVARWMRTPSAPQVLYLAGFAGTGKSTLARGLVEDSGRRWLFAAYTGKAAHVLRQKGCADAATIHSLIYKPAGEGGGARAKAIETALEQPSLDDDTRTDLVRRLVALRKECGSRFVLAAQGSPLAGDSVSGIVVDEVSMVNEPIGRDLESFGKKILVLGDPEQLPPVHGGGYFTAREPDVMLTEIHRHAQDSGVLRLATHIRGGGSLSNFSSTSDAEILSRADRDAATDHAIQADQVLVGRNETRHKSNQRQRDLRKRTRPLPYKGDRLVCLNNDRESGLFNGSQWTVLEADCSDDGDVGNMVLKSEDDERMFAGEAWLHHFLGRGAELDAMSYYRRRNYPILDWGYALTVHKAQGSQWRRVFVVDESSRLGGNRRRWLYTAVTRARDRVAVMPW